jgi:S-adenosylmethionine/arginine decarboxylase-like enzyme
MWSDFGCPHLSPPTLPDLVAGFEKLALTVGELQKACAKVDTAPSDAQIEAGNYAKGHVAVHGFDITIENPAGSIRSGVGKDGKRWRQRMANTYGYFRRTEGKDGDQVDVFLGPHLDCELVHVVNQLDPASGKLDEHKVVFGAKSVEEARKVYLANYEKGWQGCGSIRAFTLLGFRDWLFKGNLQKAAEVKIPVLGKDPMEALQLNPHFSPELTHAGKLLGIDTVKAKRKKKRHKKHAADEPPVYRLTAAELQKCAADEVEGVVLHPETSPDVEHGALPARRDPRNELYLGADGQEHWGFHLLLDCGGCNANIADEPQIRRFLKAVVKAADMKAVGEPMVHSFGTGYDGGYSAMQMITTSSITLHGDNRTGSMYVDVFSCKSFDVDAVSAAVAAFFQPREWKQHFIYRDAPTDLEQGIPNVDSVESAHPRTGHPQPRPVGAGALPVQRPLGGAEDEVPDAAGSAAPVVREGAPPG